MPASALKVADFPHGRVPRAVRERQLLELAETLFAERGYAGASMDELCRRAGVTKPVVYELFGSKDGLFRACLESSAAALAETITEAVRAELDPEGKLRAGGMAFLRFAADHRVAWEVLFATGEGRFAGEADAIRRSQATLLRELLAETAAGDVDEVELDACAHAVNGAYEALGHWAAEHPEVPMETLADWLVSLLAPGLRRFT
ncbi:MAG TPA: TetR/AcrR family transcriptional regulator [Thermoleophilaceae bacterium]|nr:TetR/AcrR family transcriptional regulator [Thermoleophilaceae bacterium]